jgi:hypothetical protein
MQTTNVTIEKVLSGAREIASLNVVATPSLPVFAPGCHAREGLESVNTAIRDERTSGWGDELSHCRDKPVEKIQ